MSKKVPETEKPEKKKKWGEVGAPGSQKRKDFMAKIRADKRTTKKQKDEKIAELAKEDIKLIESKTIDLDLEGVEAEEIHDPVKVAPAVRDIKIKEKVKIESPGEPGEPYVEYPY